MSAQAPPATPAGAIPTVAWRGTGADDLPGAVVLIDQTRLPLEAIELVCADVETVRAAIRRLSVRGAPAIGVAAAYGLVAGIQGALELAPPAFRDELARVVDRLRTSRPTAVNLGWALDRCLRAIEGLDAPVAIARRLLSEARAIHDEDVGFCAAMGAHAQELVRDGGVYLTHCNTGRFATAGIGTAFATFATARHRGLDIHVFVGEVRPLLQGSRLTTYELQERGIAGTLLPDSAVGALMASRRLDGVFVGSDRIAANGDAANKIGTYQLAVLAKEHGVPFHVVAPSSTLDLTLASGAEIPIEQRDGAEVREFGARPTAPAAYPVWNPAFDVTPAELITSIVTETGVHRPPFDVALAGHDS